MDINTVLNKEFILPNNSLFVVFCIVVVRAMLVTEEINTVINPTIIKLIYEIRGKSLE